MLSAFKNVFWHPLNRTHPIDTLGKVIWWKVNQKLFHFPALVPITEKYQIVCRPETSLGSYIVYAKWPEYELMNFLYSYLRKGDTYIDVGAHIGPELLVAATKIRTGKLFGFEPTPAIFNELVTNLKINNLESTVQVLPDAMSDKNGIAKFTIEPESEVSHLSFSRTRRRGIEVKTVRLDTFAWRKKLHRIQLLKIDTEGAEFKVLHGAKKLLQRRRIDAIIFEVSRAIYQFDSSPRELLEYLEDLGFTLYEFSGKVLCLVTSRTFRLKKTVNLVAVLPKARVRKRLQPFLEYAH